MLVQSVSGCVGVVGGWTKWTRGGFNGAGIGVRRDGLLLGWGLVTAVESGALLLGWGVVTTVESGGGSDSVFVVTTVESDEGSDCIVVVTAMESGGVVIVESGDNM